MGARYVWNRYTAVQQQGYRTRYRQVRESNDGYINFTNINDGETLYIGNSFTFSEITGKYSISDYTRYDLEYGHYDLQTGYVTLTDGSMYYGEWIMNYGSVRLLSGGYKYTATTYQQAYIYYIQGSYLDQRSNASSGYYPYDDEDGGYYYVRQGSDQVDPTAVTVPDDIDDGTTIQISITPNTGKTFGGTISYTYQYRYDGGSWQTLSTTTATKEGTYIWNPTSVESYESVTNEDGSETFTIKIFEDMQFSDGSPITAKN